jgi:hypothetical protein
MASRVNLNLPPRLIESARAAQYANREALGGRTLADKIKAKVKARRAAALRAQPLPPDRVGGVLEGRDPLRWRIWRKRRPFSPVDVGVAWLHIGQNYTPPTPSVQITETYEGLRGDQLASLTLSQWPGVTTHTTVENLSASTSLEFIVTVGARSGEKWKQFQHSLTLNLSQTITLVVTQTRYLLPEDPLIEERRQYTVSDQERTVRNDNFGVRLWWNLFPAGQSDLFLVVSIAQFYYSVDSVKVNGGPPSSPGSYTLQNTKQVSYLITQSDVTELANPSVPMFIQKKIDSIIAQNAANGIVVDLALPQSAIGTYQLGFDSVSSVIYESVAPDGTFNVVSPQQAKTSYAEYSGNPEIPVLSYKRNDPSVASTPTTERGVFGIITGASVTAPVTADMLALGLEDELEQFPGPAAANQPEPVRMVVAYDYHDRTYCRSRLAALGFTLL